MCKYFLTILLLVNTTVNSSNVDEVEAKSYIAYVKNCVLSAKIAPLPDGKDLDGKPLETGNLFIVSPRRSIELKSYLSDTIKELAKKIVVVQKAFFDEEDIDKKLSHRDTLVRLVVSRAILGDVSSWYHLCRMVISSQLYLARNQQGRRKVFDAQASSYRDAHKRATELGELTWFGRFSRSFFQHESEYHELRKYE